MAAAAGKYSYRSLPTISAWAHNWQYCVKLSSHTTFMLQACGGNKQTRAAAPQKKSTKKAKENSIKVQLTSLQNV